MKRIVVLGGSGFVGSSLCEQLAAHPGFAGVSLVVPTRRRSQARHLLTLPGVHVQECLVHDEAALASVLRGADVVINLIAILHGSAREFEQVHVELPRKLATVCQREQVRRVIHVSALGVPATPEQAPSHYLQSKARGEQIWRQSGLDVTLLRPSVIFGARDRFLNLFAELQSVLPVVALAGADARFQPVWVEDVARAIVRCVLDPRTIGQTIECAGPQVYTLAELVRLAGRCSGHARPVVPVPEAVGRLQALMLSILPGEPLMSGDNLDSMKVPNVATGSVPGLASLGIEPASLEAIGPTYLRRGQGWAERLNAWRAQAGR
ncbi:MAG: complex I NDUFA9 subunit family protein [Burkholderiales bacterium]|nr:complex I NDUFA9 subunit family protein [Burkholderiales bacterium]